MAVVTFKYTDFGTEETNEFKSYIANLVGYIDGVDIDVRYGVEHDNMFDDKIVSQISISDEDVAFDVVNHFMMDREIRGQNLSFDVDVANIALFVTGSDKISNYMMSRSFANLYERLDSAEELIHIQSKQIKQLQDEIAHMGMFVKHIGADKFPEIMRIVISSMEHEGHGCKEEISKILERKVH